MDFRDFAIKSNAATYLQADWVGVASSAPITMKLLGVRVAEHLGDLVLFCIGNLHRCLMDGPDMVSDISEKSIALLAWAFFCSPGVSVSYDRPESMR